MKGCRLSLPFSMLVGCDKMWDFDLWNALILINVSYVPVPNSIYMESLMSLVHVYFIP